MASEETSKHGEVRLENVTRRIGDEYEGMNVVEECSFVAPPGAFTVLVGPSGAGKTTIIDMIAGYTAPTSGRVYFDGSIVGEPAWDRLVVFQESALFPWMTTLGNVMYGPLVRRERPRQEIKQQARDVLHRFGLDGFASKYPAQLSGGMQRRCEIARAVMNEPKILLMDEPFRGLDAMTRELMQEYITELFESSGRTILFVTAEIDEAIILADYIVVLSRAPAHTKKILGVNLPRPRRYEMRNSSEFMRLKEQVLNVLYEEAEFEFERM